MPLALHEDLTAGIVNSATKCEAIFQEELGSSTSKRIRYSGCPKVSAYEIDTCKMFDATWSFLDDNRMWIITALAETGVSQTAENIRQIVLYRMKEHRNVRTFFVFNVTETPSYTSPDWHEQENPEKLAEHLQLYEDKKLHNAPVVLANPNKPFGPWQIEGINWVGELEVEFDIWKRDENGEPLLLKHYVSYLDRCLLSM